ncbi:MAG: peroxide stress protein YaaA [Flavobacteriales bacterium]|nr:peroxide stress protein YaaA [Flavobacteriales bacterium]
MLIVLSPAKRLDFDSVPRIKDFTVPEHLDDSEYLIGKLKKLSARQLEKLMSVSSDIANLNEERYKAWNLPFNLKNAKQAVFAFKGDVYVGLDAENYNKKDLEFAQKHIRILSGLYGVLRPLDLMQAYRLEMGTQLKVTPKKNNLYKFWDDRITKGIANAMEGIGSDDLINLASAEYFKSIKTKLLNKNIITPVFKDYKNGEFKVIQFLAKKARGYMTSYIVKNKIEKTEDIKGFDSEGYGFNARLSEGNNWVFTRKI